MGIDQTSYTPLSAATQRALARLDDDAVLLLELRPVFLSALRRFEQSLNDERELSSKGELSKSLHRIKSSAQTVGCELFARDAEQWEVELAAGNESRIELLRAFVQRGVQQIEMLFAREYPLLAAREMN